MTQAGDLSRTGLQTKSCVIFAQKSKNIGHDADAFLLNFTVLEFYRVSGGSKCTFPHRGMRENV